MIEELVGRVFATRNAVHLLHWHVSGQGSLAKHLALGELYDGLIDKIDTLVETYQGAFGLIEDVNIPRVDRDKVIEHIAREAKWITDNRSEICGEIPALENILDDLVGLYLHTYYKLKRLG